MGLLNALQHKDIVRFNELYQLLSNVLMFDLNLILLTTLDIIKGIYTYFYKQI